VIDAAAPGLDRRTEAVRRTLEEVGAAGVPVIEVYNKCDLLDQAECDRLQRQTDALCVSAVTGLGRAELLDAVTSRLALDVGRVSSCSTCRATQTATGSGGSTGTAGSCSTWSAAAGSPSRPTCAAVA